MAALSETRLAETDQLVERGAGYTFYWQGRAADEPRQSGVRFAIENSIAAAPPQLPKEISDRLIHIIIPLASHWLFVNSECVCTYYDQREGQGAILSRLRQTSVWLSFWIG